MNDLLSTFGMNLKFLLGIPNEGVTIAKVEY